MLVWVFREGKKATRKQHFCPPPNHKLASTFYVILFILFLCQIVISSSILDYLCPSCIVVFRFCAIANDTLVMHPVQVLNFISYLSLTPSFVRFNLNAKISNLLKKVCKMKAATSKVKLKFASIYVGIWDCG